MAMESVEYYQNAQHLIYTVELTIGPEQQLRRYVANCGCLCYCAKNWSEVKFGIK